MVANPAGIIRRNTTDNIGDYLRGAGGPFGAQSRTGGQGGLPTDPGPPDPVPNNYDPGRYHDYFPGDPRYTPGTVNPYGPSSGDQNYTSNSPGDNMLLNPNFFPSDYPGGGVPPNYSGINGDSPFSPNQGQTDPGQTPPDGNGLDISHAPRALPPDSPGFIDPNGYGSTPSQLGDLSLMNFIASSSGAPNNMRNVSDAGHTQFNLQPGGLTGHIDPFGNMNRAPGTTSLIENRPGGGPPVNTNPGSIANYNNWIMNRGR